MKTIIASWSIDSDRPCSQKTTLQSSERGFYVASLSATQTSDFGKSSPLDIQSAQNRLTFKANLVCWNNQTCISSNNNLENPYFKAIIDMGHEAVPFIKEELEKGPSMLVYALPQILPNVIEPEGYLPLPILCNLWLNYLRQL